MVTEQEINNHISVTFFEKTKKYLRTEFILSMPWVRFTSNRSHKFVYLVYRGGELEREVVKI